jgi:hypothetical protein
VVVPLDFLTPVFGTWDNPTTATIVGVPYRDSATVLLSGHCGQSGAVEYELSKNYRHFVAVAGIEDRSRDRSSRADLKIFADGRLVWADVVGYGNRTPVSATVQGALRLRIQWQQQAVDGRCTAANYLALGGARLEI